MVVREPFRFSFFAMGGPCELQLCCDDDECQVERAAAAAIAEIQRIERAYSRYRADNVVHAINAAAKIAGSAHVDPETANLIDLAFDAYRHSNGVFDITSGVLREIWNERTETLPRQTDVRSLLARIGLHRVRWRKPCLLFTTAGMEVDFGGLGKEYAADRAADVCRSLGVIGGLINLGGDLAVIGPSYDSSPWRIGVRHPGDGETVLATLFIERGGIATSGNYERFWEFDGRRYGHILDPRTGWPAQGLSSVTVVAPTCLRAGLMSTSALLMGQAGGDWLRQTGTANIHVDADGCVNSWGIVQHKASTLTRWMCGTESSATPCP